MLRSQVANKLSASALPAPAVLALALPHHKGSLELQVAGQQQHVPQQQTLHRPRVTWGDADVTAMVHCFL